MFGILFSSIGSGQIMSRTGKYRRLPTAGTAMLTLGMLWLSTIQPDTPTVIVMAMMFMVMRNTSKMMMPPQARS